MFDHTFSQTGRHSVSARDNDAGSVERERERERERIPSERTRGTLGSREKRERISKFSLPGGGGTRHEGCSCSKAWAACYLVAGADVTGARARAPAFRCFLARKIYRKFPRGARLRRSRSLSV